MLCVTFAPLAHPLSWICTHLRYTARCVQSMLVNGSYFPQLSPDDVYFDENLRRIPDISVAGKAFYTWTYRKELAPLLLKLNLDRDRRSAAYAAAASVNSDRGGASARSDRADVVDGSDGGRVWLRLRGVSYFATVYVNGVAVSPAESPNTHRLQGMFHRWSFDLGKLSEIAGLAKSEGGFAVAVRVEPPEYPGAGCTKCADPPCTPCGQGGDHQIARNPAMMQFMQGNEARRTCTVPRPPLRLPPLRVSPPLQQ